MEPADLRELFFLNERASYETDMPPPQYARLMQGGYVRTRPVARQLNGRAYYLTAAGRGLVAALVGHANALSLPALRSLSDG